MLTVSLLHWNCSPVVSTHVLTVVLSSICCIYADILEVLSRTE